MTKEDLTNGNHYDNSWEPRIQRLILERLAQHNENKKKQLQQQQQIDDDGTTSNASQHQQARPFMVAIVGVPGTGKSISSMLLAHSLDEAGVPTMIMPHDGYHLPLEQLKQFPDAADKLYRRGAPDTFDPASLQRDLDRIRNNPLREEGLIMLPGFDHARGDPEPDAHAFDRHNHQVVICEGLVSTRTQYSYIIWLLVAYHSAGRRDVRLTFYLIPFLSFIIVSTLRTGGLGRNPVLFRSQNIH